MKNIIEALEVAADWVKKATAQLDVSEVECPACRVKRKTEWKQAQAAKELEAIGNKLQKWIKTFRKGQA
jgi:TusA-related sulfurtransferase